MWEHQTQREETGVAQEVGGCIVKLSVGLEDLLTAFEQLLDSSLTTGALSSLPALLMEGRSSFRSSQVKSAVRNTLVHLAILSHASPGCVKHTVNLTFSVK